MFANMLEEARSEAKGVLEKSYGQGIAFCGGVIVSWFQESWPIEVVMTLHSISSQAENLVSLT